MTTTLSIVISTLSLSTQNVIDRLPISTTDFEYVIVVQGEKLVFDTKRQDIRIVYDTGLGVSRSRNLGSRHAQSEFTLFSDDDITLNLGELQKLVLFLKTTVNDCFLLDVELASGERVFKYLEVQKLSKRQALLCWAVRLCVRTSVAREIGFNEKISIGTDIPLGEETIFVFECMRKKFSFYQLPLAPARLNTDSHSGDRCTKSIMVAKGMISAHLWKTNILFYIYNTLRLASDLILILLKKKTFEHLFKYQGILQYLTDSEIQKRFRK